MTDEVEAFLQPGKPEPDPLIKRGRYQIVPANGGNPKPHTRVTNFAKKLEDEYGLTQWKMRTVMLGTAMDAGIGAMALANSDDTRELDGLVEKAMNAARANVRRETGTALHRMTERVDAGEKGLKFGQYEKDMQAYTAALESIEARIELIEAVIVHEPLGLAGRLDRTVLLLAPDGGSMAIGGDPPYRRYIADLKTGEDLSYSWGSIAVQLAIYAGATTIYDPKTKKHSPMVEVDQGRALVIHLPPGKGKATLYWVNLEAGRYAIELTQKLQAWRKGTKSLVQIDPAPFVARPELREYTRDRVLFIISNGLGAELAAAWPHNLPTLKSSEAHTELQLDLILTLCDIVAGSHGLRFDNLSDPRTAL